jgi:hypothetical protein
LLICQILQTPGYVAIVVEMIHDARIIPMDGRAHVNSSISQWLGDSRGRWDGNTLVMETTGLRHVDLRNAAVFGTSGRGKVIERFTRVAPDAMSYTVTVEGRLYEYACHEGNYGLPNILSGHRQEERDKEVAAQKR